MREKEAIVIGAGFAGAGTARELKRRGVEVVALERNQRVAEPWRGRYDSLRLNTTRWQSHMPGRRMPRSYGRWPRRDDVVAYLEDYVQSEGVPVRYGVEATRVDTEGDRLVVRTSDEDYIAGVVVVASGFDKEPKFPDWPGREGFSGEILHACDYMTPAPFRDKDVLVVSAGNTGSEVSLELLRSGAARVRTAIRSAPNIVPRELFGIPGTIFGYGVTDLPRPIGDALTRLFQRSVFGDLSDYSLPRPAYGMVTNVLDRVVSPAVDDGFVAAVKAGEIEIVSAVEGFDNRDVLLAGGARIQPDVVIAATGYRRALEGLVGHLGVLKDNGLPTHLAVPGPPAVPGLWFVGYDTLIRGQLPLTRKHAKRVARAATAYLHKAPRNAAAAEPALVAERP